MRINAGTLFIGGKRAPGFQTSRYRKAELSPEKGGGDGAEVFVGDVAEDEDHGGSGVEGAQFVDGTTAGSGQFPPSYICNQFAFS